MSRIHKSIMVTGKVQGVYYRAATREQALALGVTGTVENRADGTVVLEAEGEAAAVDALIRWCRQGPPAAEVTGLTVTEGAVQGYAGFEVIRSR
ncbi:acylphosphatase [Compostibacter hankyongensis]|uniref:acylphosphatase n=1 Tax=Compostibacter hankyongensis TaxID=1007089 RepID=A0ABP8FQ69_9BACT